MNNKTNESTEMNDKTDIVQDLAASIKSCSGENLPQKAPRKTRSKHPLLVEIEKRITKINEAFVFPESLFTKAVINSKVAARNRVLRENKADFSIHKYTTVDNNVCIHAVKNTDDDTDD